MTKHACPECGGSGRAHSPCPECGSRLRTRAAAGLGMVWCRGCGAACYRGRWQAGGLGVPPAGAD